jgi:hypothetical protein
MSSQAAVHSIDALKDFRAALALYGEDTLEALGSVEAEVRRTVRWLHEERPYYWQEQIKRRREQVAMAKAEVFRRRLQKRPDYTPPMSEQMENLRKAEASLQDAERRLTLVRKWQPVLKQAILEYHGSIQRLKDISGGDVPRAVNLLTQLIDALEAYVRVAPPSGLSMEIAASGGATPSRFVSIANAVLDEDAARAAAEAETVAESSMVGECPTPDLDADTVAEGDEPLETGPLAH